MNSNIQQSNYYQSSYENLQLILYKIKNLELTYYELNQLAKFSKLELEERFKMFSNHYEPIILEKIQEKIVLYENLNEKISLCEEYLEKIRITENEDKKNNEKIKSLIALLNKIDNFTILSLENIFKDGFLIKINQIFKRAQKIKELEKLECGKIFIRKLIPKLEKEEIKYQNIMKSIQDMEKIFKKDTIKTMNESNLRNFYNLFTSLELFCDELHFLKLFLGIQKNENLEYLKFNFQKLLIKNVVSNYINLIQILNLRKNIFLNIQRIQDRIKELDLIKEFDNEEIIKKNFVKINKIIFDFEIMGRAINLKINPLDSISIILKNLWEKKLFEFLFNISNNEIRDLNNLITDNSIDINDIDNYLKVKQLIIIFKKAANYHPKNSKEEIDEISYSDSNESNDENEYSSSDSNESNNVNKRIKRKSDDKTKKKIKN